MTDDQGYGVPGTFGGVIPMPALDRIAKAGLRYTEFNSTTLRSPIRAALITGPNHHEVGFGVITELIDGSSRLRLDHRSRKRDHRQEMETLKMLVWAGLDVVESYSSAQTFGNSAAHTGPGNAAGSESQSDIRPLAREDLLQILRRQDLPADAGLARYDSSQAE